MNKFIQYLKNVRTELSKVSWPSWGEVRGATLLVVILSVVASIFVYICDKILFNIIGLVINTGTGI